MKKRILFFLAYRISLLLSWVKVKQYNLANSTLHFRRGESDLRVFRQIFQDQEYFHFPEGLNPKVIIDAGANVGYSAVWFAEKFPKARILALEPFPTNVQLLKKNVKSYPAIEVIPCALWFEDTTLSLHDPGKGAWGIETHPMTQVKGQVAQAFSIDSICIKYQISQIDILKLDVEGAEYEIFKFGPLDWLDRVRLVQMETHESRKPGVQKLVDEIFASRGFQKWTTRELSIYYKNCIPCLYPHRPE